MEESEKQISDDSLESLEGSSSILETPVSSASSIDSNVTPEPNLTGQPSAASPQPPKKRGGGPFSKLLSHFNLYLLGFMLLVVVAAVLAAVLYFHSKDKSSNTSISSQGLSQSTLNQLSNSDVTVGDAKQTLNVQSNAVFGGQVLIRSNLEVAGKLQIGSSLSLTGITVAGTSNFDQVQVGKNLSVAGDTALQGQLTVQKGINVNGGGTFNGAVSATTLTANSLQINGDLVLTHHISAGGSTPGRSTGGSLGSGGTASVSGSDTAGSITLNTGSGASAGCLITVNFTTKFNATPHVIVTPVGSAAGGLGFYINRSTTNFSVCTSNAPPSNATFGFDYMVLD